MNLGVQRILDSEELADRSGLHRTHLWKIEKGQLNAGIVSYARIAKQLDLPPGALLPEMAPLEQDLG